MANDIVPVQGIGQRLSAGDRRELFKIEMSGLVLNRFREKSVFLDRHTVIGIDSGKGARVDAIGEGVALYHTPGMDLSQSGNNIPHDAFEILVDAKLIAPIYIDEIEEAMNHYPVRERYALKLADALARVYDQSIAATGILAARHAARVPGGFGGSVIYNATFKTDPAALYSGIVDASVALDLKSVDSAGRVMIMRPEYHAVLLQNLNVINNDFNARGSIAEGEVIRLAGFEIIKSITMPNSDVTGTYNNKYDVDATNTVALAMSKETVGTVQLKGLATEMEWDKDRQATFMAAKFCLGHGVLRPETAVELRGEVAP